MADFRKYSEKYGFRQRSETPEIAIELSLQPWRAFDVDGVIMFSGSLLEIISQLIGVSYQNIHDMRFFDIFELHPPMHA